MCRKNYLVSLFSLLFILLAGCVPLLGDIQVGIETPVPSEDVITDPFVVTQEPTATEAPTLTSEAVAEPTSVPAPGLAAGAICFPSEMIPPMTAFFQEVNTGAITELAIAENQASYTVELPQGQYVAFAYINNDQELGGMYSQAQACGLGIGCSDHSLVVFDVLAGSEISGIDICDWYSFVDVPVRPDAVETTTPDIAGLIYSHNLSLWQVGSDGTAAPILNTDSAVISPDGVYAIYEANDDLWVTVLETGERWNVTNTPGRIEGDARWVPGSPPAILFGSYSIDEEIGLSNGYLSIVSLDGSGYQVLDANSAVFAADVSPDGQVIVYSVFDAAWFYRIGGEVEAFVASDYGLDAVEKLGAMSFSADGKKLAWWVSSGFGSGGEGQWGLAIFDLENRTARVLHMYMPVGGSPNPAPVWNPEGEWVATHVLGDGSKGALWAMRTDGTDEEVILGNAGDFVWRPDGQALVYVLWPENGGPAQDSTLVIADVEHWISHELPVRPGSFPLAWLDRQ